MEVDRGFVGTRWTQHIVVSAQTSSYASLDAYEAIDLGQGTTLVKMDLKLAHGLIPTITTCWESLGGIQSSLTLWPEIGANIVYGSC